MSTLFRLLLLLALALPGALPARAADEFLPPEQAFRVSARAADERHVELRFEVAPGYYLYREPFRFSADAGATIAAPELPPGKVKFDETFQKEVETYRGTLAIRVPVEQAAGPLRLTVVSQGCADAGLCYPPMASVVEARLAAFGGDGSARVVSSGDLPPPEAGAAAAVSPAPGAAPAADPTGVAGALRTGRFWVVLGVFFGAGLLLSLTPCVLPMLPILSSIVVGDGHGHGHAAVRPRSRSLLLSAVYSLGMALVYTAFGIAAGLAGEGLAAWLQNAWVLGAFALLLGVLALSMFGVYEFRLPAALVGGLSESLRRLRGGHLAGVFAMGGLSALIVSPCVAAPLAGALVYLGQTRDVVLGGSALFALAAGMSVPLLLLGASAGALLPKAGSWMEDIKRFFGLLLLGVAIWIVQPVLAPALALFAWGALLLGAALWAAALGRPAPLWRRAAGLVAGLVGVMQLVGAASGGSDPLQPLAHLGRGPRLEAAAPAFERIGSVAELDAALARGKPVMLDFYADWCVSCKEMERFTFADAAVRERLARAVLLKADVTANSPEHRALLRRFGLFGPPGTLFFDAQGRELDAARVIGFQDRDRFLQTLASAGL